MLPIEEKPPERQPTDETCSNKEAGVGKEELLGNGIPTDGAQQLPSPVASIDSVAVKFAVVLRLHWPLLALLCLSHICIGMANALPGSSLMHLARQVGVGLSDMGFWFTAKSAAACLLALLTGFVFNRLPDSSRLARPAFLAAGNLVSAGAMLGASLARSCALALSLAGLLGAGHGALETVAPDPALAALLPALGGLIAPLMLHPFLAANDATEPPIDEEQQAWESSESACGRVGSGASNQSATRWHNLKTPALATSTSPASTVGGGATAAPLLLVTPYSVLAALQAAASPAVLPAPVPPSPPPIPLEAEAPLRPPPLPAWRRRCLVVLTAAFYFASVGGENIFWSFGGAYASCAPGLQLSARGAAALQAAFFAGFLVGRGLGVVVSRWARPTGILLAHLVACLAALATLSLSESTWLAFAGTAAFGLAVSVLYATGVTWLEQRLPVAGPVACSWLIGGQLGMSALPPLAGYLLVSPAAGPASVMHLALGSFAVASATFLGMLTMASDFGRCWRRAPVIGLLLLRHPLVLHEDHLQLILADPTVLVSVPLLHDHLLEELHLLIVKLLASELQQVLEEALQLVALDFAALVRVVLAKDFVNLVRGQPSGVLQQRPAQVVVLDRQQLRHLAQLQLTVAVCVEELQDGVGVLGQLLLAHRGLLVPLLQQVAQKLLEFLFVNLARIVLVELLPDAHEFHAGFERIVPPEQQQEALVSRQHLGQLANLDSIVLVLVASMNSSLSSLSALSEITSWPIWSGMIEVTNSFRKPSSSSSSM
uniref:MFS domain-containing protein n=1 Tax=Macrostomum lignano TaxID=282301 RepID=A0A1I8HGN4_9PLAT